MILKSNNKKVTNLVKYFETLSFADKLRLSIDMLESYHIKVKNDNANAGSVESVMPAKTVSDKRSNGESSKRGRAIHPPNEASIIVSPLFKEIAPTSKPSKQENT